MKIIYNRFIPLKGFKAINLFGVVFARKESRPLSDAIIRHESIHTAQMQELFYVGFYLLYLLEWLFRSVKQIYTGQDAYHNISFEKEAYAKQSQKNYLTYRKPFAQWKKQ